jgi:hypothetical protein
MRAVATTLPSVSPQGVETLTTEYTNIIEAIIAGVKPDAKIMATSYRTFTISCAILDAIEPEIPTIAGKIDVVAQVTREQRREFLYGTTVVDGCIKGGTGEVAS